MKLFKPKEIVNIYTDFDIKKHKEDGFKAILLDVDNTIAIPDTGICDEKAEAFIRKLQDNGFIVYIFSNNNKTRVLKFIRDLDVNYYYLALKPLPFSYLNVARKINIKPKEIKTFYYKKANFGQKSMDDINYEKSIKGNDLIMCSSYLSVGVDICGKYKFAINAKIMFLIF